LLKSNSFIAFGFLQYNSTADVKNSKETASNSTVIPPPVAVYWISDLLVHSNFFFKDFSMLRPKSGYEKLYRELGLIAGDFDIYMYINFYFVF
jgi:hypothetical protein